MGTENRMVQKYKVFAKFTGLNYNIHSLPQKVKHCNLLQFKWLTWSLCLFFAAKMNKQHQNAQYFFLPGPNGVSDVSRQPQLAQQ